MTSATAHPERPPASGRSGALDGLRGLAALAVLVFHAWLYSRPVPVASARSSIADYALHELRLGLVLFFALSGFLLYRPWVAAGLGVGAAPGLRRYFASRARRVLPAYYLALAGSVALLWGLAGHPGVRLPPAESLPLFAIFAQNLSNATVMKLDPPMWTLAIEVSFYLALPVFGALAMRLPATRSAQLAVPITLTIAGLGWMAACHANGLGMAFTKSLPAALPYFASGMAAAVLLHDRTPTHTTRQALFAAGVSLVLSDAAAQALAASGNASVGFLSIVRDLVAAIGFALIIAAAASAPRSRLGAPGLVLLGTLSYGIYLWNVPLLVAARAAGALPHSVAGATLVALTASIAVAAISWRYVERPVIRGQAGALSATPSLAA